MWKKGNLANFCRIFSVRGRGTNDESLLFCRKKNLLFSDETKVSLELKV